jgi:starch synthase
MRIVQVCAEFAPIAKAGGMGEMLQGLTRELLTYHHEIEVIVPKYEWIDHKDLKDLKVDMADVRCQENGKTISNVMWSAECEGCPIRLLEPHHPSGYFHRDKIYGYEDDTARFLYFCKAVVEYLVAKGGKIDLLHLHDWHTAPCAILVRELFPKLKVKAIVLTVHNFEYQGRCATWDLDAIGLNGMSYLTPSKLQDPDPRHAKTINLLKGGILYADAVNTVSPSYARETLTSQGAHGLHAVLKQAKLFGILNGIDIKRWDPEKDPYLTAHYAKELPISKVQIQKNANKRALQKLFGLESLDRPLFGVVSRLIPNKGSELLRESIAKIVDEGGAFVLVGSSPISNVQEEFDQLKQSCKNNPHLVFCFHYNERIAHQVYAACDFLLVPSLVEPCGLTQLIALRYGTIPIVRATGGLRDTVFDCEDTTVPSEKRNGLVFRDPTKEALQAVITRAIGLWKSNALSLQLAQKRAIQGDYGWKQGAKEYIKLYEKLHAKTF